MKFFARTTLSLVLAYLILFSMTSCSSSENVPYITTDEIQQIQELSESRPTFTNDALPNYSVLNSVTDHPTLGDEREFIRVYDSEGTECIDAVNIQPYRSYEVRVYFMNDGTDTAKPLRSAKMDIDFPYQISSTSNITSWIYCKADYPAPTYISDSITLEPSCDLDLSIIRGSLHQTFNISNGRSTTTNPSGDYLFVKHLLALGDSLECKIYPSRELQYVSFYFFATPVDDSATS